jgi:hypothetical protein
MNGKMSMKQVQQLVSMPNQGVLEDFLRRRGVIV